MSLELKVPLVASSVLLLLLGFYTWIAYQEVAQTARSAASQRDERLATELAQLTATSSANRARMVSRVANLPAIRRSFETRSFRNLADLDSLRLPGDSTFFIVLFDSAGRALHFSADTVAPELLSRVAPTLAAARRQDTLSASSPLLEYLGRAHVWSIAAVRNNTALIGYVAQLRTIRTNPASARALQSLIGGENRILFANTDHMKSAWVDLGGNVVPAPDQTVEDDGGWRYRRGDTWYIAGKRAIAGTPYQMIVESPEATTRDRPQQFLRRTGVLGLLLLLGATVFVWIASRQITRPIRHLRDAAGAIEHGHLQQRVQIKRNDELGALGRSFNQMATEIERSMQEAQESRTEAQNANRSKSEFLANMSHEIRTPINAILGYTDLMDGGVAGAVTEQQRSHLERIRVSGNHLVGLIDDLLDFARLDVARLSVEQKVAASADSIATAVTVVSPQADAKQIRIEVTCAPDARYIGDPKRVEQILVNLLGNAVKFTSNGGRVALDCHAVNDNGKRRIQFHVRDNGIGIPEDRLEAIFEPFVQARGGYTRPHGGTGLGLSISSRLAELMGGRIDVESEIDVGSRFTLTLPSA